MLDRFDSENESTHQWRKCLQAKGLGTDLYAVMQNTSSEASVTKANVC